MKSEFCVVIIRIIQIIISIMFVTSRFHVSYFPIRTYNSNASRNTRKDFMRWLEIDLRSLRFWVGRPLFVGAKGASKASFVGSLKP